MSALLGDDELAEQSDRVLLDANDLRGYGARMLLGDGAPLEGPENGLVGADAVDGYLLLDKEGLGRDAVGVLLGLSMLAECTDSLVIGTIGVIDNTDRMLPGANALVEDSDSVLSAGASPLDGMAEVPSNSAGPIGDLGSMVLDAASSIVIIASLLPDVDAATVVDLEIGCPGRSCSIWRKLDLQSSFI